VVLVAGLALLWHGGRVAEAAVLVPHPGLVGWWRFDEGSGSVAGDSSGNGNNGTIYGATWVPGKYGDALSFDGADDYVQIPSSSSLNIGNAISVEAWINGTAFSSNGWNFIVAKQWAYELAVWEGRLAIRLQFANNGDRYYFGSSLNVGQWYYLVMTYDGSAFKGYINGQLNLNIPISDTIAINTNPLQIGAESSLALFNGVIDEVHIYNRALSAAEIQADFQKGPDFSSRLLATVPKGTTQFITTVSWQGIGTINVTIVSPSQNYTENMLPEYQKTVYSTSSGTASMLNIKRLSVSVSALSSDQTWYIVLTFANVDTYQITVEVQK
jgi:hypothetical protein